MGGVRGVRAAWGVRGGVPWVAWRAWARTQWVIGQNWGTSLWERVVCPRGFPAARTRPTDGAAWPLGLPGEAGRRSGLVSRAGCRLVGARLADAQERGASTGVPWTAPPGSPPSLLRLRGSALLQAPLGQGQQPSWLSPRLERGRLCPLRPLSGCPEARGRNGLGGGERRGLPRPHTIPAERAPSPGRVSPPAAPSSASALAQPLLPVFPLTLQVGVPRPRPGVGDRPPLLSAWPGR